MERIRRLEMQLIILRRLETRTRNLIYARPKCFRPYLFWGGRSSKIPESTLRMIKEGLCTALRFGIA